MVLRSAGTYILLELLFLVLLVRNANTFSSFNGMAEQYPKSEL